MTYIVVARHPLDAAVSLYHQGANIDRAVLRRLVGLPEPAEPPAPRPGLHDWLVEWIEDDPPPEESFDSLPGVLWHLTGAWERRAEPNMLLVRYADLEHDLEGAMREDRGAARDRGRRACLAGARPGGVLLRDERPRRDAPARSKRRPEGPGCVLPPRHVGRRARGAERRRASTATRSASQRLGSAGPAPVAPPSGCTDM